MIISMELAVASAQPVLIKHPPRRTIGPKLRLLPLLGLTLFSLNALADPNAASATRGLAKPIDEKLRIFICGHSFHTFIWVPLREFAHGAGLQDRPQYLGSSTSLQHWNLPDDKNKAKEYLTSGVLDVLTLAPIAFPDEGVEKFVKLGLAHNPNMRFTVQLSWGAYDGDNQLPGNEANSKNLEKTPEQLLAFAAPNIKAGEAQVATLNQQLGQRVVFLVPTAQAIVALRTRIYNQQMPGLQTQGQLFADSIGHAAAPIQALNSYLHYAVIYRSSPVGLPIASPLKNSGRAEWGNDTFARALQELAWAAVTNYPPSGVPLAAPATE